MSITISGSTGVAGNNGSAGTPAYQGEDTNTGVFFPAADTVAVATAGTERVTVTSVGRVGVGTNSPNQLVHVSGGNIRVSSASENTIITNGGNFTTGAVTDSAILYGSGSLLFGNGSTERMRLDASGNLGIGTTTPSAKLELQGNSTVASIKYLADGGSALLSWKNSSGTTLWSIGGGIAAAQDELAFVRQSTPVARFDSSGNFLVNATSNTENAKMFVRFSGDGVNGMALSNTASSGAPTFFAFNDTAQALNNTQVVARYTDTSATRWELRKNGGLANYSANNVNLSDERVKTDVTPLGSYWDKIKALQVVTYKYLDQSHGDDNIGVIAQQVESVAPELVSNDGFGETPVDGVPLKSIYEADLHYAALKALQEAMARIEELTARVATLEAK
jgi:hypothetical protein